MSGASGHVTCPYWTEPEKTKRLNWLKKSQHKKRIIDGLVESNNTLSSTLSEQSNINSRINAELLECIKNESICQAKIQILEDQLTASREAERRLSEELRDAQHRKHAGNNNSATLDIHIVTLEKEIQKLEFDKDWMGKEIKSNAEKIQTLNESLRRVTEENETSKSDNSTLKTERVAIEKNLIDAHAKVQHLELECGIIKGRLEKEKKSRVSLKARLSQLDKTVATTEAEKGRLEAEARVTSDQMKGQIASLDRIVNKKTGQIRKLQNDKLQLVEYYSTRFDGCKLTADTPSLKATEAHKTALRLGTSIADYLRNKNLELEGKLYRRERLVDELEEAVCAYDPTFSIHSDPDLVSYLDQPVYPDIASLLMYTPAQIIDDNISDNSKNNRNKTAVVCDKSEEESERDEAYISMATATATADVNAQQPNNSGGKETVDDTAEVDNDTTPETLSETSVVTEVADSVNDSLPSVSSDTLTSSPIETSD